jgi:hypothetical protein
LFFLARFAARFSAGVLAGFFLDSFFRSIPLLIADPPLDSNTPVGNYQTGIVPQSIAARVIARIRKVSGD